MKRSWLYILVIAGSLAGFSWIFWNLQHYQPNDPGSGITVCLFRKLTGIPCPSCGSTRSLLFIAKMDFKNALYANPLGFILAFAIVIFPFWILYDIATRKSTFYTFYRNTELFVQKRWVMASLIFVVLANWFWNIHKCY